MNNKKDDIYYINKVLENIDIIISYCSGVSYEDLVSNGELLDAIMFRLIQMIENLNRISKDYKNSHKSIKWGLINGFRNGIVHEYGKTDYKIVFDIINNDIIELKSQLIK